MQKHQHNNTVYRKSGTKGLDSTNYPNYLYQNATNQGTIQWKTNEISYCRTSSETRPKNITVEIYKYEPAGGGSG